MAKQRKILTRLDVPQNTKQITPRTRALLDAAHEFQCPDYDPLKTFIPRELVQATLPHRNPGDVPRYMRKNGNYGLVIQPGWDIRKDQSFGYPYGTIPRLLIFWLTTEALRTGGRKIKLGCSMAEFMHELGLNPDNGSGKRSDAKRLQDQIQRLFNARISFQYWNQQGGILYEHKLNMEVAPKSALWWNEQDQDNPVLLDSWIELGEQFYEAITASPMPADMNALKLLKNSPLKLDLYAWAVSKAFKTWKTNKSQFVPWKALMLQIGSDYSDVDNFKKKAKQALKVVQCAYPQLRLEDVDGGVKVLPSPPAIRPTASKRKSKPKNA